LFAVSLEVTKGWLTTMFSSVDKPKSSSTPTIYRPNYASIFGGATILMKTSNCRGIGNILSEDTDKYMYTESTAQVEFVIGLKEEIAMESISIKSMEMYSSIIKHFKV
jgi:hypothetical protein